MEHKVANPVEDAKKPSPPRDRIIATVPYPDKQVLCNSRHNAISIVKQRLTEERLMLMRFRRETVLAGPSPWKPDRHLARV